MEMMKTFQQLKDDFEGIQAQCEDLNKRYLIANTDVKAVPDSFLNVLRVFHSQLFTWARIHRTDLERMGVEFPEDEEE